MKASQRTVTQLPLNELWNHDGPSGSLRKRYLSSAEIKELLHLGNVQFVVANVGDPIRWIPVEDRFEFWRTEADSHIADPLQEAYASDFPEDYFYFASEWSAVNGTQIVLLEKCH